MPVACDVVWDEIKLVQLVTLMHIFYSGSAVLQCDTPLVFLVRVYVCVCVCVCVCMRVLVFREKEVGVYERETG